MTNVGYKPTTPALKRLRQEDQEFKANLGHNFKSYLKTKQQKINTAKYFDLHNLPAVLKYGTLSDKG